MLLRIAMTRLSSPADAEDVVQEVFVKLLRARPVFHDRAHCRAWLLRVTVNGCKSRLRAPWRRRTAPLLDAYPAAAPEEGARLLRDDAGRR